MVVRPLNRTKLELKPKKTYDQDFINATLNRTKLELKHGILTTMDALAYAFKSHQIGIETVAIYLDYNLCKKL